jgi:hypothetical protein
MSPADPAAHQHEPGVLRSSRPRPPLFFEANRGQAGRAVRFLSRGPRYTLFLIAGAIQVNLRVPDQPQCGRGNLAVVLLFGGVPSQEVATISVR